ncbi:Ger(x)C family spore germination protein [Paenibacillus sp. IB182496]|uniref:Ger(X)C family spore germination protein n=1 Tax=Paenibacillus sabuli TaxID=2772509 RepID=A0A927BWM4_9BACL|nr:Ger(x)C family spore germination protein [Paenibacillus sabuli]MBD2847100.1 Ger(x)C family spore germination protein [Paenibacillus sabuli]
MAVGVLFVLAGCGYKDIDKRFFVVSIGVDKAVKEELAYTVILKLAVPQANIKSGAEEFILVKEQTNSITEAIRIAKAKVDKELDFSHAKLIVFGKEVAKGDMRETIDFFTRRRDIQGIAWVGVADPTAEEVLALKPKSERLPSNSLFLSFGDTGTVSPYIITEYMFSFRKRLYERGLDPILPIIRVDGSNLFAIDHSAVFDKKRMQLVLSPKETALYSVLSGRANRADIKIKRENGGEFFLAMDESHTSIKLKRGAEGWMRIAIDMEVEGVVEEVKGSLPANELGEARKEAEETLQKEALNLLLKLQKHGLDPFGIGLRYRGSHIGRSDWDDWTTHYPDAAFDVRVDVIIQTTGGLH